MYVVAVVLNCSCYQTAYTYIFVHLKKKFPKEYRLHSYNNNTLYKPMRILHTSYYS